MNEKKKEKGLTVCVLGEPLGSKPFSPAGRSGGQVMAREHKGCETDSVKSISFPSLLSLCFRLAISYPLPKRVRVAVAHLRCLLT